jgi:membrane-bound inhibitor of C-type lysozyme
MPIRLTAIAAVTLAGLLPAAAQTAGSANSALTLTLEGRDTAELRTVTYDCEGLDPLTVEYVNAAPNFLALVPVEGETLVFTAVLAASGVRYAAAQWEWWTTGAEASLRDLTLGPDAEPVAQCLEFTMTP